MRHDDETVREAAAKCMETVASGRGLDLLEKKLKDKDESESVRMAALESLKHIGSEPALSPHQRYIKGQN